MPNLDQRSLSHRLLRGGVAPGHVIRIVTELRDHFEDLKTEAMRQGQAEDVAERQAAAQLGTEDSIVECVLTKPELKSWAARWPWAIYGLAPAVGFTVFVVVLLFLLVGMAQVLKSFGFFAPEVRHLTPYWLTTSIDIFFLSIMYLVPLIIAAIICRQVVIRHATLIWPAAGLFLLCLFGAALDISVIWPRTVDAPGALQVGFALAPPFPDKIETAIRMIANIGLVALVLRFYRKTLVDN